MIATEQCHRPVTERLSDGSSVPALPLSLHNPMTGTCKAANGQALAQRTILLVEDDDTLRRLIRLILKGSGFQVVEAGRGLEALALGRDYPGHIHLLVTDLVLPEVDGQKIADY